MDNNKSKFWFIIGIMFFLIGLIAPIFHFIFLDITSICEIILFIIVMTFSSFGLVFFLTKGLKT